MLGKLENLEREAKSMQVDILGLAETRYTEDGRIPMDNYIYIYSGGAEHHNGVGFVVKKSLEKHILGYWALSERNMMLKIRAKPFNIAIIQTYAPTTSHNDEEAEVHYEEIQRMLKQVKSTDVLIVMGDFNAKIGVEAYQDTVGKFGLGKRNERVERLLQFCIENNLIVSNTFFQHPKRLLYTWKSPGDITRNQIDYILINKRHRNNMKQCKTYPGADIGSDHNPVVAKIKIRLKKTHKSDQKKEFIDWGKLNIQEEKEKYLINVQNKFEILSLECMEQYRMETTEEKIDNKWQCLKGSINHANKAAPKKVKRAKQKWMTDEILDLMDQRKKAKNTPEYSSLKKEVQEKCRDARENWIESKCEELEECDRNNATKRMHEEIKVITGNRRGNSGSGCIKDKDGNLLFEKDQILNRWSEYAGDLFADNRPPLPTPSNNEGTPILKSEVRNAMMNSQNGKAPGEDGITTEMLRALEDFGVDRLTELFNDMYSTGHMPDELLQSIYITLPKKARATECSDYRTLSMMPHVLKIFLKVLQERNKQKINREVGSNQFGSRPGSGTREGLFCFNTIAQKHVEVDQDLYTCFIDYSKAFDRIHHATLIECLEKIGMDGKDIRIITNLYWHQKAAIKIENELSPFTSIRRGVRQGCVLSPYLFNIYTEFIFREVEELEGISINGININNLRYVDDTALFASDEEKLQKLVDVVKECSSQAGLDMNAKKTKTMVISKHPERDNRVDIKIDGESLEQVHQFKYLGTQVTDDARTEKELKCRIGAAKTKFSMLSTILTSKQLRIPLKIRVLGCYVFSVFGYGSEAWTLTKAMEDKIEAFEMWCLRRMGRISWKDKKTNADVLKQMRTERKLLNAIKQRKLRYFGHVKRQDSFLKQVMEGKLKGKRPRGRPRTTWLDNVEAWTGRGKAECTQACKDRRLWSVITSQPLRR